MYARDHALIATPVGSIRIDGDDAQLDSIQIGADGPLSESECAPIAAATAQLLSWFAGERTDFDLPLAAPGTARGATLRNGLIAVGYGETLSYGALATRLGSSPRAIGQLCARNPFPIVVPCHRILGSGGALGSYSAGGGARTKLWLLEHERRFTGGTLL